MPPPAGRLALKHARRILQTSRFHHTRQCVCGAPRFEHSGARKGGGHPRTRCTRYRGDPAYDLAYRAFHARVTSHIDVVRAWQDTEYPRPVPRAGGTGVGPSDHGRCKRSIQYRELGVPDGYTEDETDENAATIGQIIHDGLLRAYAHQYWWRLTEHPVWIPGLDRYGRVDMLDPVTGIVYDIKTLSEYGWDMLLDDGVPDYFWKQLLTYAYALAQPGADGSEGFLPETLTVIAVRRSTGEVRHFHRDYDDTSALDAIGELRSLDANLELARLGVLDLPRLADGGPTRNKLCAHYCRFKSACWGLPQADDGTGRTPESRVLLGDPADAEQVAFAAETLREWRRSRRVADKSVKDTATLLVGVDSGVYGDWKVARRPSKGAQYTRYYDEVQAAVAAGATPEEIGRIPIHHSTTYWYDVTPEKAGNTFTPTTPARADTPTEP